MHAGTTQARIKQLTALKMRVELIAWRIQETGMSPQIRKALPASAVNVFDVLLHDRQEPDEHTLCLYEDAVRQVEEELAQDLAFWRTGEETLH
jgi:hypothetical protein